MGHRGRARAAGLVVVLTACSSSQRPSTSTAPSTAPSAFTAAGAPECHRQQYAPPSSTTVPSRAPADGLRFQDVTAETGIVSEPRPACVPPTCLFPAKLLQQRFPKDHFEDNDDKAWCTLERFAGGVAVGDYDGDGRPDVYVSRLDGPGHLFHNDGGMRFTDVTRTSTIAAQPWLPGNGPVFADIDGDGDLDLVVNTLAASRLLVYVNDGRGRFREDGATRGVAFPPGRTHAGYGLTAGDYDGDGYVDLYATEYLGGQGGRPGDRSDGHLFRNLGRRAPGHFEDVTDRAGVSLADRGHVFAFGAAFADFDGDGHPDLAVTGDFDTSRLFWNNGNGTFTDGTRAAGVGTDDNGMGSAIGDYDGDGRLDWFVSSIFDARGSQIAKGGNWAGTGNRLFRNVGSRRFTDVTATAGVRDGQWGWGSVFVDFANRGLLDIVQASGLDQLESPLAGAYLAAPTRVWRRDQTGGYVDAAADARLTVRDGRGVAAADLDGDGRVDLLIAQPGGTVRVVRNVSQPSGSWVGVRVHGNRPATDAFGTVVSVLSTPRGRVQTRVVGSSSAFVGWSDPVVHIGLGPGVTTVPDVRVRFVSGRVVELHDVAVNRVLDVHEPPAS